MRSTEDGSGCRWGDRGGVAIRRSSRAPTSQKSFVRRPPVDSARCLAVTQGRPPTLRSRTPASSWTWTHRKSIGGVSRNKRECRGLRSRGAARRTGCAGRGRGTLPRLDVTGSVGSETTPDNRGGRHAGRLPASAPVKSCFGTRVTCGPTSFISSLRPL